jgi:NAD(P)-dependent dehydrogenase (short-subunit alcohol dehydrogenase family)
LRATLAAHGGQGIAVSTDVTDEGQVRHLFRTTQEHFGRVDLLFNNAGVLGATAPFAETSLSQWRMVLDTNLTGVFLCAREAFRIMRDQQPVGGRIINNGSVSAHAPRPHGVAYTASKTAITGLTKTISLEGRPHRIACGQIDIGNAATNLTEVFRTGTTQADGSIKVEPTFDVRHVADAVLYMAGLPLDTNVQFMTLMATGMPLVGRG